MNDPEREVDPIAALQDIKRQFVQLRVQYESQLLVGQAKIGEVLGENSNTDRDTARRAAYENQTGIMDGMDRAIGDMGSKIAAALPPDERLKFLRNSLKGAKSFWEQELKKPDHLSADQILLGQRRLTRIKSELERLGEHQERQDA
jgi:hypothetical protein